MTQPHQLDEGNTYWKSSLKDLSEMMSVESVNAWEALRGSSRMVQHVPIINSALVLLTWVPISSGEEVRTSFRSLSTLPSSGNLAVGFKRPLKKKKERKN